MGWTLFSVVVSLVIGYLLGHRHAHCEIAKECCRLGGFYVDGRVFKCSEVVNNHKGVTP